MRARILLVKIILTLCLSLVFISASHAEYNESDLKNLFTTKKQRAKIDAVRFGKYVAAPVKRAAKKKTKIKKVKISGYVTRSDGKSVVWLNGKNTLKNSRVGKVNVQKTGIRNNKVTVSVDGKTIQLKPGQTWTETKGVSDPVK
jgi:hypothetical protein